MDLSLISLLFLVACIAVGFAMKRNIGFLAIALAMVLGHIGGVSDQVIISGFNVNLFMILLGVSYLFAIAQENKTLELVARKTLALVGERIFLLPPLLFLLGAFIAMIGPGTIASFALMSALATALSLELNISPLKLVVPAVFGAWGGGVSPIAPTGIIALNLSAAQGYIGFELPYLLTMLLAAFCFSLVFYFASGCHKLRASGQISYHADERLNRAQWLTISGMALMALLVLIFNFNVGLVAFMISAVLNLLSAAEEKHALSAIPWGTLILVCGVGVLMNLVILLGGIDRLSAALAAVMTPRTAPAIMCLSSGIMGWFASSSGVVMPALLPTVSGIVQQVGNGLEPVALISAITCGTHLAAISPASTGGALALASYITLRQSSVRAQNRYFLQLFTVSALALALGVLLGLLGLFSWLL